MGSFVLSALFALYPNGTVQGTVQFEKQQLPRREMMLHCSFAKPSWEYCNLRAGREYTLIQPHEVHRHPKPYEMKRGENRLAGDQTAKGLPAEQLVRVNNRFLWKEVK